MRGVTAAELSRRLLGDETRRLQHVAGVADCAEKVATALVVEAEVLVSAAWLHDVGYAPDARDTGLHSLDGARYLQSRGTEPTIVNLVAHHSCALLEAEERGLEEVLLSEFPFDASFPHAELCYCDMTTGPDGQRMDVMDRLAEIKSRYGPEDVVTRFITRAEPEVVATVRQVERRLAAQSR